MLVFSLLDKIETSGKHLEAKLCTMLQSVHGTKQYWFLMTVANYDRYSKAANGDRKYSKLKNLVFQTTSSLTQKGKQEIRLLLLSDIGKRINHFFTQ